MWPRNRPARGGDGQPPQEDLDAFTARAFEELGRPPPRRSKDFLGAAVTLAIIGAIVLEATNVAAAPCRPHHGPRPGHRACAGVPAIAYHAAGIVTWAVAACGALAAAAFIWYMFWGYKTSGHPGAGREIGGPAG